MTGHTASVNFPVTAGAFDTTYYGGDAFVVKLNPAGSGLTYSTFLGGNDDDQGYDIALDAAGSVYVTGYTKSSNFPTTAGAFDTSYNGARRRICRQAEPCRERAGLRHLPGRRHLRSGLRHRRGRRGQRLRDGLYLLLQLPDHARRLRHELQREHRRICRQTEPCRKRTDLRHLPGRQL